MTTVRWVVLLTWLLAGISPAAETKRLQVLTTFLPVYCFAVNIAGTNAEVQNLLPPGTTPHDYQFSRRDLQKLKAADLIFINGLGLENWLDKLLRNASASGRVVAVTSGLESQGISGSPALAGTRSSPPDRDAINPHLWLDPRLALYMSTNIARALGQADPAGAGAFEANLAAYSARLSQLDAQLADWLAPAKDAALVTYHDAFPYFARRYGLRIVGVIESIPDVAPSARYINALRDTIVRERVKAIFMETGHAGRLPAQLGRDLKLPVATLDTLETGPLIATAYEAGMRTNGLVLMKHLIPHANTP